MGDQRILIARLRDLDRADCPAQIDNAAVGIILDQLHPRDSARSEEAQHCRPVIRRTVAKPHRHAAGRRRDLGARCPPQRARAATETASGMSH